MKRSDIKPQGVYSLVSYRDSRQGWPVMILSADSYELDRRTKVLDHAGRDRLSRGDHFNGAVGLLTVKLAFSMNEGEDVLDFRAKVDKLRDLVDVSAAITAINASADKAWDDREHLMIRDAEGELLGHYELLTGLQMVPGPYVELTLAHRQAEAQRDAYAAEHEQARVASVATFRSLSGRLDALGITGYHVADWESPTRFEGMRFEDMETLVTMAEQGHHV
jgi:hypothetical protein